MKSLLLLSLLFIFGLSYSQTSDKFPRNEKNEIFIEKVIELNDLSKNEIYSRVKLFFADEFKSANDVIQIDDKETGIILGKGNTNITIVSGKFKMPVPMSFTLKVLIKDHKAKFEFYDIYYSSTTKAETFFNSESDKRYVTAKQKTKDIMDSYILETDRLIKNLESKFTEALTKNNKEW